MIKTVLPAALAAVLLQSPASAEPGSTALKAAAALVFDTAGLRAMGGTEEAPVVVIELPRAKARISARPAYEPLALVRLLDRISVLHAAGFRPILLTDLDDTLNDTAGRRLRIFKEFLSQPDILRAYPEEARLLNGALTPSKMRYYPTDTALDAGARDKKFLDLLMSFFRGRYFEDEYLLEDWAVAGSVEYVAEAVRRGATMVYLSARWEKMRQGTLAQLGKLGFPQPDGQGVHLFLKANEEQSDEDFKNAALYGIARMGGRVAGGFENEPRNVNSFQDRFGGAIMIFADTRASGERDPISGEPIEVLPGIPWVKDFTGIVSADQPGRAGNVK